MKIRQKIIGLLLFAQILPAMAVFAGIHVIQVGETNWDKIEPFSEGLAGVCRDGQWGFINTNGNLTIPLQREWKYAFPFEGGLAQVDAGNGNADFIDKSGQSIVRSEQRDSQDIVWPRMLWSSSSKKLSFSSGCIPVENKEGKWGFMNQKGELVITPRWGSVLDFQEGLARISNVNPTNHATKCGFINTNGQIVIPLQWEYASSFCEGMAVIMTNGLCGFINQSGKVVVAPQWNACQPFRNGFALVMTESPKGSFQYKFGIIDKIGNFTSEPQFTGFTLGDSVMVFLHDKKGIIDSRGQIASGSWWDSVKFPPAQSPVNYPKLIKVEQDKKWGLVNIDGKIVVRPIWEDVGFSEAGFTPVKQDGKWGILDQSGKFVVHPRWESVSYPALTGKTITAKENGKWGLFDTTGKLVVKPEWDAVSKFSEGFAAMQLENKWGLIDQFGKVICEPKWDFVEPPHDGVLRVRDGNKWLLMRVERN